MLLALSSHRVAGILSVLAPQRGATITSTIAIATPTTTTAPAAIEKKKKTNKSQIERSTKPTKHKAHRRHSD